MSVSCVRIFNCINQAYQQGQKHIKDAWLSAVSRYLGL